MRAGTYSVDLAAGFTDQVTWTSCLVCTAAVLGTGPTGGDTGHFGFVGPLRDGPEGHGPLVGQTNPEV